MTRCAKCGINYPDDLVSAFVGSGFDGLVCGICALALSNEIHGDDRSKFTGIQAEAMRQGAIRWRKKHDYAV